MTKNEGMKVAQGRNIVTLALNNNANIWKSQPFKNNIYEPQQLYKTDEENIC